MTEISNRSTNSVATEDAKSRFLQSMPFAIFSVRSDWIVTYLNPEAEKVFGIAAKMAEGRSLWEVFPGLTESTFGKNTHRAVENPNLVTTEAYFPDHDRWYRVTAFPLEEGTGVGFSDITQQKKTELLLNVERQKLASLFDHSPIALALFSGPTLIYEMVNSKYQAIFPERKLLGLTLLEALPELKDQAFEKLIRDVFVTGQTFKQAEVLARLATGKDGELVEHYYDLTFAQRADAEGRVYGVICYAQDVTEQRLNRLENEQSRQRLEDFFMQAPIPMVIFEGPEHRFTLANPPYENFVGRSVRGKTLLEAFSKEEAGYYVPLLDGVYQTGIPYKGEELPVNLPDKNGVIQNHWINIGYHPFLDATGKIIGIFVLLIDVTDRVLDRQALRKAIQVRDELLSICSHELRTPVAAMTLSTQMFLRGLKMNDPKLTSPERVNRMVEQSDRQLNRLTDLIEEMLDFSRINNGKLRITPSECNLGDLVSESLERIQPQFDAAEIRLVYTQDATPQGKWDCLRLEQVFTNILSNALKYGEGKPVEVTLKQDARTATVEIRDHGAGIAQSDISRIFKPYERAVSVNNISGLGLGLYISEQIVHAHGGTIEVASELGQGSVFTIALPKQAQAETPEMNKS